MIDSFLANDGGCSSAPGTEAERPMQVTKGKVFQSKTAKNTNDTKKPTNFIGLPSSFVGLYKINETLPR